MTNDKAIYVISLSLLLFSLSIVPASAQYKSLPEAAKSGDYAAVKEMLNDGADINTQDFIGGTALMYAVHQGNIKMAAMLIKRKADLNMVTPEKNSALQLCIGYAPKNKIKIVQLLLKNGADPNVGRFKGWTNLMIAIDKKDNTIAKLLIKNGADVNLANVAGYTALMIAAKRKNLLMIKLLIRKGARINARTNRGGTVYDIALMTGPNSIVNYLKSKGAKAGIHK